MKYLFVLATAIIAFSTQSCNTMKTLSKSVKDSVVYVYHDTTVTHEKTVRKDSVVIHDSVIGISGQTLQLVLDNGSTTDTIINKGSAHLHRYIDDKKKEHIDITNDSLTLVIQNFVKEKSWQDHRWDSFTSANKITDKTHTEVTVKEKQQSWFGRMWARFRNAFAWFGLICLVAIIIYVIKKFAT